MAHMKRGAVGSGRGGLPRCAQVWPPCLPFPLPLLELWPPCLPIPLPLPVWPPLELSPVGRCAGRPGSVAPPQGPQPHRQPVEHGLPPSVVGVQQRGRRGPLRGEPEEGGVAAEGPEFVGHLHEAEGLVRLQVGHELPQLVVQGVGGEPPAVDGCPGRAAGAGAGQRPALALANGWRWRAAQSGSGSGEGHRANLRMAGAGAGHGWQRPEWGGGKGHRANLRMGGGGARGVPGGGGEGRGS